METMQSGFSCSPIGLQIGFENYYGVSILPIKPESENERLVYNHVCVAVFQEVNGKIEDRFTKIIEAMGYKPSYKEIEYHLFFNVSPEMLTLILHHVAVMEVTFN